MSDKQIVSHIIIGFYFDLLVFLTSFTNISQYNMIYIVKNILLFYFYRKITLKC